MTIAVPHSRTDDPITSYMAGEDMHASGAAYAQAVQVLDLVFAHPGSTSRELAAIGGLDRYVPARRLPELERSGEVRRGEIRKCRIGGRASATWWPPLGAQGRFL